MVELDSEDQKPSKKMIAKILLNFFFEKKKQSGNLNSKKKNFPRWQIDIFFLPRPKPQNLLKNVIKHCLSYIMFMNGHRKTIWNLTLNKFECILYGEEKFPEVKTLNDRGQPIET